MLHRDLKPSNVLLHAPVSTVGNLGQGERGREMHLHPHAHAQTRYTCRHTHTRTVKRGEVARQTGWILLGDEGEREGSLC
jgi:hypothetical protein